MLSELDEPLTKVFQDKVLPAITDISVKDIKTQYSYSAENHSDLDGVDNMTNPMADIMEIGFENFLTLASTVSPEDRQSLENVRAIQIFTNLFREEFESQMADGIRNLKGGLYYYLDDIPWKETFKSDSLNGTVIKPMVECIVRGGAILGTKGVVEIVMVSTATNAVSTMNSDLTRMFVKDMGGSDGTAMVAGIISGLTTSYTSNRIMGNAFFNTVTEVNGINGGVIDDAADDVLKGGTGSNKIPDSDSILGHIFREAEGHIPDDTPQNRALLEDVANDIKNLRGTDKYGNKWFTKILEDGREVWVELRDGKIFDGGINESSRSWKSGTGLKK